MSAPHPQEVCDDLAADARDYHSKTTLKKISKHSRVVEATLTNWLKAANLAYGNHPPMKADMIRRHPTLKRRKRRPIVS